MEDNNNIPSGFVLSRSLVGHEGKISRIAWSPNGKMLASSSEDKQIIIWNVESGDIYRRLEGHTDRVYSVSWSPDGEYLISSSKDKTIRFWDIKFGKEYKKIKKDIDLVFDVEISPHGRIFAVASANKFIKIWDIRNDTLRKILKGHSDTVNCLAWIDNGRILASASNDMTIKLWDTKGWVCRKTLTGHSGKIFSIAFLNKENVLASGSSDNTIKLWNISNGQLISSLEGHKKEISSISFSKFDNFLASKSADDTVIVWRCNTREPVAILNEIRPKKNLLRLSGLAFHPDKAILASLGEEDKIIRIWHLDFKLLKKIDPVTSSIHYINAKAILIGNSGVGKTGLGIRIAENQFRPTPSTHGANFWHIPVLKNNDFTIDNLNTHFELILWDFAGQPEYRLIHQLFLDDMDIALLLFDCSYHENLFDDVKFWAKILKKNAPSHAIKYLIASRCDVSTPTISENEISHALLYYLTFRSLKKEVFHFQPRVVDVGSYPE